MPHHCVIKDASTTTKLRLVFDASAKTTTGRPLNDCLMVGLKLQDDLFSILIRFRFFKFALSTDVAKMYRQVGLDPRDRDFMRLFWRFSEDDPVQTFRLTRVIHWVASSSYHPIQPSLMVYQRRPKKQSYVMTGRTGPHRRALECNTLGAP